MLKLKIEAKETFDPITQTFVYVEGQTLTLEHSLISLSKWESTWEKPFLSPKGHDAAEILDYIRCMTITQNVDPRIYISLSEEEIKKITAYIEAPMTATTFSDQDGGPTRKDLITSEIFYYWMTALNIPFECEKWHLNRLYTLIRVCAIKNQPGKKMNTKSIYKQNRSLNAARRAAMGSKG